MKRCSWVWMTAALAAAVWLGPALAKERGPSLQSLQKAVQADPKNPKARYMLGLKYEIEGQPAKALKEYEAALRLKPDYPEVLLRSGELKFMQGNIAGGIQDTKAHLKLKPQSKEAREALAYMYGRRGLAQVEQGNYDQAIASLKEALQYNPKDDGAMNNLGVALSQQGRMEEAAEAFQQAALLNPNNAQAQFNLGAVFFMAGNKEGALQQYAILGLTNPREAAELFALISFPDPATRDPSYAQFKSVQPDRYPDSFVNLPTPEYPSPLQEAPGLSTEPQFPRLPSQPAF